MYFRNPLATISPAVAASELDRSHAALSVRGAPRPDAGSGLQVWVFPDGAGNVLLTLRGELGGHTAPLLDALIRVTPDHTYPAPRTVTLDFADVTFVYQRSITDLQQLFEDLTAAGWQVSLANARPDIADLLAITRQVQTPVSGRPPAGRT